jgi:hypothetical protein
MVVRDCKRSSPERHFCERWFRQTAQQNEAPPVERYFPLEDWRSGESCSCGIRIAGERVIFRRANCLAFAPAVFENTQSTSGIRFFCSGGILFIQSTSWVLISCCGFACNEHFISHRTKSNTAGAKTALQEIRLLEEIQG